LRPIDRRGSSHSTWPGRCCEASSTVEREPRRLAEVERIWSRPAPQPAHQLHRSFSERRDQRPQEATGVAVPHEGLEIDSSGRLTAAGAPMTERDPAAEDPSIDAEIRSFALRTVLLLDIVELFEHIGLARQEHAAPMLDAADEHLGPGDGASGLRQPD